MDLLVAINILQLRLTKTSDQIQRALIYNALDAISKLEMIAEERIEP